MMFLPAVMIAQSAVTNTISFDMDDIKGMILEAFNNIKKDE